MTTQRYTKATDPDALCIIAYFVSFRNQSNPSPFHTRQPSSDDAKLQTKLRLNVMACHILNGRLLHPMCFHIQAHCPSDAGVPAYVFLFIFYTYPPLPADVQPMNARCHFITQSHCIAVLPYNKMFWNLGGLLGRDPAERYETKLGGQFNV